MVVAAISWGSILYGALLSGIAAGLLVFAFKRYRRRIDLVAAAALSGALGPFLWNAILHHVGGSGRVPLLKRLLPRPERCAERPNPNSRLGD